jgi:hypothetical protein
MSRYYQDLKLFVWLRKKLNVNKPYALPWGGWENWEEELKANRPVAYFLTETLPDWLEKPAEVLLDPLYNARYYLRNRFVTKTHYLKTNLEPGKWHEYEKRILHGLFTELVSFVEIEQAGHHVAWDDEARKKHKQPWWHQYKLTRLGDWRCPEAGLAYLHWAMELDEPVQQAESARETLILYTWWKDVYSTRRDEWEETGLREFWNNMDAKYGDGWLGLGAPSKMTKKEQAEYDRLSVAVHQMEEDRAQEEEDMMIRLIKLRRNLWT